MNIDFVLGPVGIDIGIDVRYRVLVSFNRFEFHFQQVQRRLIEIGGFEEIRGVGGKWRYARDQHFPVVAFVDHVARVDTIANPQLQVREKTCTTYAKDLTQR